MKRLIAVAILAWLAASCVSIYTHEPGGPYYFQTFVTNFQEPLTLQGEMTEAEAQAHTAKGASIYIAWFNEQRLLSRVEKRYRGTLLTRVTYEYKDGELVKVRTVDEYGRETVRSY